MEDSADFVAYAFGTAIGMVGLAYASVPMYQALCKKFGWGGTTGRGDERRLRQLLKFQEERGADAKNRRFLIRFECQVTPGMPWYFTPTQEYVVVRPGETALAFFTAYNDSDDPITGVSTYNIMPYAAAPYFQKVQCFCFEEQRLRGREKVDMPVLFYVEPSILEDPALQDCHDLTLAYNFFEVVEEAGPVEWDDDDGPDVDVQALERAKRKQQHPKYKNPDTVPQSFIMRGETEGPPVDGSYIHPDSYKREILDDDDPMVKLIKSKRRTVNLHDMRERQQQSAIKQT